MYYLHEIIFAYMRVYIPRASKVLNIPENFTAHLFMTGIEALFVPQVDVIARAVPSRHVMSAG